MKTLSLIGLLCSGMIAFSGMASAQMASPDAYITSFATQFRMGASSISLPATGGNDTSCAPYDTALAPTTNTYLLSATNIPADAPKECGCKDTAELRQARLQSADVKLEYFAQGCKYSGSENGASIIRNMLQSPALIPGTSTVIATYTPQVQTQTPAIPTTTAPATRFEQPSVSTAVPSVIPAVKDPDSDRPKDPCLSPKQMINGVCSSSAVASSPLPEVKPCPLNTKDYGIDVDGKRKCAVIDTFSNDTTSNPPANRINPTGVRSDRDNLKDYLNDISIPKGMSCPQPTKTECVPKNGSTTDGTRTVTTKSCELVKPSVTTTTTEDCKLPPPPPPPPTCGKGFFGTPPWCRKIEVKSSCIKDIISQKWSPEHPERVIEMGVPNGGDKNKKPPGRGFHLVVTMEIKELYTDGTVKTKIVNDRTYYLINVVWDEGIRWSNPGGFTRVRPGQWGWSESVAAYKFKHSDYMSSLNKRQCR